MKRADQALRVASLVKLRARHLPQYPYPVHNTRLSLLANFRRLFLMQMRLFPPTFITLQLLLPPWNQCHNTPSNSSRYIQHILNQDTPSLCTLPNARRQFRLRTMGRVMPTRMPIQMSQQQHNLIASTVLTPAERLPLYILL